ncbi:MAG: 3D domain-containing protein [Candidatus Moranbacteria bacterium]|nr:3D domain-containing protein [Candidatus Moranbacteria bacterium]
MRLAGVLIVIRLIAIMIFPAQVLAFEEEKSEENKNQYAQEQSQKQNKFTALVTMSDVVMKNTPALWEDRARVKSYAVSLTAEEAVYGKETQIMVTGYSSTPDQCWGNPFRTASGTRVHTGTMACPPEYPFGTKIEIEGMGTYTCEDRGGAIKGNIFDMWFPSRGEALNWGRRTVNAKIATP